MGGERPNTSNLPVGIICLPPMCFVRTALSQVNTKLKVSLPRTRSCCRSCSWGWQLQPLSHCAAQASSNQTRFTLLQLCFEPCKGVGSAKEHWAGPLPLHSLCSLLFFQAVTFCLNSPVGASCRVLSSLKVDTDCTLVTKISHSHCRQEHRYGQTDASTAAFLWFQSSSPLKDCA